MDSFNWLFTTCTPELVEAGTPCVEPLQFAYLVGLLLVAVLLGVAARRSRDFSTSTLTLMPVAIAINIAVGSIVYFLKLPIYMDSIGTVLVGVLAGPWAGALTGLLANLIWALLPIPGGAGPIIAFFAPVAAVIGLMAGFWGSRGVFRLRADDVRVGSFLALALGIAAIFLTFLVIRLTVGLPDIGIDTTANPELADQLLANQTLFVTYALLSVAVSAVVAWLANRSIFRFDAGDAPRIRQYLAVGSGIATGLIVFIILRLVFGQEGWLSLLATDPNMSGLSSLVIPDPLGWYIDVAVAILAGAAVWYWARRGDNARLFPVWVGGVTTGIVAAAISAPIAAIFFGGVTGAGTDLLVSLYRTLGLNVFTSVFAQGLTSDPLDKTISYTVVYLLLAALPITVRTLYSRGETTVAA
jgi:energy-coupling factor transport system substrate-specific component